MRSEERKRKKKIELESAMGLLEAGLIDQTWSVLCEILRKYSILCGQHSYIDFVAMFFI